jgi:PST family polysaccharide transporter
MGLKENVVKGGLYLSIVNVLSQFLSVFLNIILARLLYPEAFGLMALATTYLGLIAVFTNIGFGASIIQNQKATQIQLSTLYWINLGLSTLTFAFLVESSGFAAHFYQEPQLQAVIWWASISILMTPFFITHYKIKEKELQFKLLSRITLFSTISGAIGAIIGALVGLGVYALVAQTLVSTAVKLFLTLRFSDWKPNWIFQFQETKNMVFYSLKFKLSSLVLYFERNVDYLILGKVFESVILGYYSFAYNVMYTPVKRISYIFNDVLFPTLSTMQDRPDRIVANYFKSVQLISIIAFPLMTFLAIYTEPLIQFVFGNKWDGAIPIVKILCYAGAVQSISQLGSVVFNSIGRPEIDVIFGVVRTSLTTLAVIFGARVGVEMVAWYLLASKVVSFLLILGMIYYFIPFKLLAFLKIIYPALVTTLMMLGIYQYSIWPEDEILNMIITILVASLLTLTFNLSLLKDIFMALIPGKKVAE